MRIVHDIETPMQVSCGCRPYVNGPGKQGYGYMRVDVLIVTSPASNHPELPEGMWGSHEAIYIEGDSRYIIKALEDALAQLRMMDTSMKERLGEVRPTGCPDRCGEIVNGMHEISCPKHPNFEYFRKEREAIPIGPPDYRL